MNPDDLARLSYLVLLGVAVVGWFIAQNRGGLGKAAQQAMVWGLIFIGVIAGFGLWNDIQRDLAPSQALLSDGRIEVPVSRDGHYHLTLGINGTPIDFVIDTGASQIVLTREDAARVGIDPESLAFIGTAQTANGTVGTARITLDEVTLGDMTDLGVRAVVNEGDLFQSLLGMAYLSRMARIEIADGLLILTP